MNLMFFRPSASDARLVPRCFCVGAALALNVGAVGWIVPPPAAIAPPGAGKPMVVTAETVAPRQVTEAPGSEAIDRQRPVAAVQARPEDHLSAAPRKTPSPSPVLASLPEPARDVATSGSLEQAHFYTFNEVEIPAAPADDWELDAATLDSARIDRLVFDLFVSDAGAVVACTILEPAELDEALRSSLEARLRSTVLLPAIRTGQPVDSVRRIELSVS